MLYLYYILEEIVLNRSCCVLFDFIVVVVYTTIKKAITVLM